MVVFLFLSMCGIIAIYVVMCSDRDGIVHTLIVSNDSNIAVDFETSTNSQTTVRVQSLVSGVSYKARVKARTVMGWSPWSQCSDVFRMKISE